MFRIPSWTLIPQNCLDNILSKYIDLLLKFRESRMVKILEKIGSFNTVKLSI